MWKPWLSSTSIGESLVSVLGVLWGFQGPKVAVGHFVFQHVLAFFGPVTLVIVIVAVSFGSILGEFALVWVPCHYSKTFRWSTRHLFLFG